MTMSMLEGARKAQTIGRRAVLLIIASVQLLITWKQVGPDLRVLQIEHREILPMGCWPSYWVPNVLTVLLLLTLGWWSILEAVRTRKVQVVRLGLLMLSWLCIFILPFVIQFGHT